MKTIMILAALMVSTTALAKNCQKHPIFCQIKKNNPDLSEDFALKLSNEIYKASKKYDIPANIYTAILMQESSYRLSAVNKRCGNKISSNKVSNKKACVALDVGISQINVNTAKRYKFNIPRLQTDLAYSVDAGAKVLSWFKKTYEKREFDWWVRYNVGTRPKSKVKSAWKFYYKKVSRWL